MSEAIICLIVIIALYILYGVFWALDETEDIKKLERKQKDKEDDM